MKSRYTIILVLFAIILIQGCESMITDVEDPPAASEKLVVTSFISPDLPYLTVNVFRSRPIYSTNINTGEYPQITTAVVTLSNGGETITIPYDQVSKSYRIPQTEMKINKGQTYYLKVSDKELSVEAQCTVPDVLIPDIEIMGIDSIYNSDYGDTSYHVNLRFRDSVGLGQFYHVTASYVYAPGNNVMPVIIDVGFSIGEPFISDKNKDGDYFSYVTKDIFLIPGNNLNLVLSIGVTDENYYQYHKGVNLYRDDNPFAEPAPMFSNIKGGLGVFAAYVQEVSLHEY